MNSVKDYIAWLSPPTPKQILGNIIAQAKLGMKDVGHT